jgi:hypothetical protein
MMRFAKHQEYDICNVHEYKSVLVMTMGDLL